MLPVLNPFDDSTTIVRAKSIDSLILIGLSFHNGRGLLDYSINPNVPMKFGGAIFADSSVITLRNCYFNKNAADRGGAVFLWNCTTRIINCKFDSNEVNYDYMDGGAVSISLGNGFLIKNSIFMNNKSNLDFHGAVAAYSNQISYKLIDSCTFVNNYSKIGTGALFTNCNRITNNLFLDNMSSHSGALSVIIDVLDSSYFIQNNSFISNTIRYDSLLREPLEGSAIYIQAESTNDINVISNYFLNNTSILGNSFGTVVQQRGNALFKNNIFYNNFADRASVYLARLNATAIFDSNLFNHNISTFETIRLYSQSSLYVHHSDFVENIGWTFSGSSGCIINAENNFWGHPSGPRALGNPNGQGDSIPTGVPYIPFRTTPVFPELDVKDFRDYGNGGERGQNESVLPNVITIEKVYPNPTNSTLTVHYTLSRPQLITIKLYDTNGREVYTSLPQPQIAGSHTFSLQTDGIASGLYFLKLSSPVSPIYQAMQKVVLIK